MWYQLKLEGIAVARRTVERLMKDMGLECVARGKDKPITITTFADLPSFDLVPRDFTADRLNRRWVADFAYVATWSC